MEFTKKEVFFENSTRLNTASIFAQFRFIFAFYASYIFVKNAKYLWKTLLDPNENFRETCRCKPVGLHAIYVTQIKIIQDNRQLTNSLLNLEESFLMNEILRHSRINPSFKWVLYTKFLWIFANFSLKFCICCSKFCIFSRDFHFCSISLFSRNFWIVLFWQNCSIIFFSRNFCLILFTKFYTLFFREIDPTLKLDIILPLPFCTFNLKSPHPFY